MTSTASTPPLSARPPPTLGRTSQLVLSLLNVGNCSIVNTLKRAKAYDMTAPPGHTRELERWFNRPKAANSTPRVCTRFSSRRTGRLTTGWFELKKDLGTFRLPDLRVHGAEKEHGYSSPPCGPSYE
ncbi:hypothetical protein EDB92DRAFT_2119061, partial [Lactarius akahatsu]